MRVPSLNLASNLPAVALWYLASSCVQFDERVKPMPGTVRTSWGPTNAKSRKESQAWG